VAVSSAAGGPQLVTVLAEPGDTLQTLAARLYKDERAASLLAAANPALSSGQKVPAGTSVRIPDKATAQQWSARHGIALGYDPTRASGTKQKRAWKAFQTGPTHKAAPAVGPEQVVHALLVTPGPGVSGPGIIVPSLLADELKLRQALSQRLEWLGSGRVLEASTQVPPSALASHARALAFSIKGEDVPARLGHAVSGLLVELVALETLKEARRLFARAQQALAATAQDEQGGDHVLSALKEADPDARVRLLGTLGVARDAAATASDALDRVNPVRTGLAAAALKPTAERVTAVTALRIPRDRAVDVARRLRPPLSPADAEALALQALGLDAVARQAREGAAAMLAVVERAAPGVRSGLSAEAALAHLKAARTVVYRARALHLDPAVFPPAEAEGRTLLEQALLDGGQEVAQGVGKLPELLRVAWRVVETLGPELADVDASAVGRGVGCLLARVASGAAVTQPDDVKRLRAADLMAFSSQAASRAQSGTETTRALAPLAAALAAATRLTFAQASAPPGARTELRRRLVEGFRAAYAVPPGLPPVPVTPAQVRSALVALLEPAARQSSLFPDAEARVAALRPVLEKPGLCEALAAQAGPARCKFRRDEVSLDGKWLCAAAWLVSHARELPAPEASASRVARTLTEEGGRLLDAVERALLERLG
jgi:phage tail protein X